MKGKKGLIMGVANERSIAWGISQKLSEAGAELAFTYLGDALKKRVLPLAEKLNSNVTFSCDVEKKDDVIKLFEEFILVKLYTDGREEKHKRYRDLEINRFKTAALPYYVVLNKDDEVISTFPGYNTDVNIFIEFLEKTIEKHNK